MEKTELLAYYRAQEVDRERMCTRPLSDETFHTVFSLQTLEHLMDPDSSLKEIARVLRPGGTLFLFVPVNSGFNAAISHQLTKMRPGGKVREHLQVNTLSG